MTLESYISQSSIWFKRGPNGKFSPGAVDACEGRLGFVFLIMKF